MKNIFLITVLFSFSAHTLNGMDPNPPDLWLLGQQIRSMQPVAPMPEGLEGQIAVLQFLNSTSPAAPSLMPEHKPGPSYPCRFACGFIARSPSGEASHASACQKKKRLGKEDEKEETGRFVAPCPHAQHGCLEIFRREDDIRYARSKATEHGKWCTFNPINGHADQPPRQPVLNGEPERRAMRSSFHWNNDKRMSLAEMARENATIENNWDNPEEDETSDDSTAESYRSRCAYCGQYLKDVEAGIKHGDTCNARQRVIQGAPYDHRKSTTRSRKRRWTRDDSDRPGKKSRTDE
jgi:hypothetical protein